MTKPETGHPTDPAEWTYEEPDPTVGFRGGWTHEDCPASAYLGVEVIYRPGFKDPVRVDCHDCDGYLAIPESAGDPE
jgi:hypothetical protein